MAGTALASRVARLLSPKPAIERYRLLKEWTLPNQEHSNLRVINYLAPREYPPEFFFQNGKVAAGTQGSLPGPYGDGVISLPEMLVQAAAEAGKLKELGQAANDAAAKGLPFADTLVVLVAFAQAQDRSLGPQIEALLAEWKRQMPPFDQSRPLPWPQYLIARAWLRNDAFRNEGETLTDLLVSVAKRTWQRPFQTHATADWARSRVKRCAAGLRPGDDPGLALWHLSTHDSSWSNASGWTDPWWVEHQGIITHLAGPETSSLYFDYPLTGAFEFSVDGLHGAWAEAAVNYGGYSFEPMENLRNARLAAFDRQDQAFRAGRVAAGDRLNRIMVRVEPNKIQYLCNGYLLFEEKDPSPTSPWLALFAQGNRCTSWANLRIAGQPTIPREVRLVEGNRMDGWSGWVTGDNLPKRLARSGAATQVAGGAAGQRAEEPDWKAENGVLQGRPSGQSGPGYAAQSLLAYHRPIRSGDTLSYEFFCQPGQKMVHPSLGRIAMLLEPDAVRLHWITEYPLPILGGLAPDNAVVLPEEQVSPKPLPLKPGAWNAMAVSLTGETVTLKLNGTEIYRRRLAPGDSRTFGLFRYKDRTAAEVRNVVLKGNWPESLSAGQLADLTARVGEKDTAANRRARAELVGEKLFALNADVVLLSARALPPEQRYSSLRAWVLPEDSTPRLYGSFAPCDSPPVVKQEEPGGMLRAPALELIAVARQLGKLDELTAAVNRLPDGEEYPRRCKLALLALIAMTQGRDDQAESILRQMGIVMAAMPPDAPIWQRWPEQLALWGATERPKLAKVAYSLLDFMVRQQLIPGIPFGLPGFANWELRLRHLISRAQLVGQGQSLAVLGTDPGLKYWRPVVHTDAIARADGSPRATWALQNGQVHHYPGHRYDYLYFTVPLGGTFEINAELPFLDWRDAFLAYAGRNINVHSNQDISLYRFSDYVGSLGLKAPSPLPGRWYAYRLQADQRQLRTLINGKQVYEDNAREDFDPWLAIRCWWHCSPDVRSLQIVGKPSVPQVVNLSNLANMEGWLADYYGETLSGKGPDWSKQKGVIEGRKRPDMAGVGQESVLYYHRPLLEDGQIEYSFYYEPEEVLTHPALDRLVFLLEPKGVRAHWLTDGPHDRTGLAHDNVHDEPANRRGEGELPLKPQAWNQMKLAIQGDTVRLTLNGVLIYQRKLEPENRRMFGLFHYADQTQVQVRNVTHAGQWPREVPKAEALFELKAK